MHKKCSVHNFWGVLFVLEGIFLFVHFEPTLKVHMKYGKRYRNKRLTFVPILMRLLYLPFVPVFIRTLQLFGSTPYRSPPTPPTPIHPTQQNDEPKDPARARHARGRTRLPALLVVLRWRRGGGGLPSVWYQSAPPPRARRWRTGGLQVRGLRPAPWRRVHRYVRAPSRRRNEQPKSTASPTTRPRLAVDGVCVRLSARPYTESGVVYGWGRGGWRRSPQSCLTTAAQVPSTYDHPNQQGHCLRSTRLYRLGHT